MYLDLIQFEVMELVNAYDYTGVITITFFIDEKNEDIVGYEALKRSKNIYFLSY